MASSTTSKAIRARLSHPVIDSDGHWREFEPIAMDYLRDVAGPKVVEKWGSRLRALGEGSFAKLSRQDKFDRRAGRQIHDRLIDILHIVLISIEADISYQMNGEYGAVDASVTVGQGSLESARFYDRDAGGIE